MNGPRAHTGLEAAKPKPATASQRRGVGPRPSLAASRDLGRKLRPLIILAGVVLVVACLYWAQAVLMPLALAILITFLLTPVVDALRRIGLPRVPAVLLVVILALSVSGGIGWALTRQAGTLADDLPKYRANIARKMADIRQAGRESLGKVQDTATDVMKELEKGAEQAADKDKPVPVVVAPPSAMPGFPAMLEVLAKAAMVLVLVVFMLLRRQELRSRIIRFFGHGRLTVTTRALDEAGSRISRYLLMQSIMNSCFGLSIGLGLFLIGIPYALLWGFFAALLRFIPYVGAWIAAGIPVLMSLAVFDGWTKPLLIIGLVLAVEFVIAFVLEPLLYGKSAGVSEVALLVATGFWTWLWGPAGLVLATPLTVCLVVLARNIQELDFIVVLMSDDPVLEPEITYYQRLLAGDEHEAEEVVEARLKLDSLGQVFDEVLVPALVYAKQDRSAGRLSEEEEDFIASATREIIDGLPERAAEAPPGKRLEGIPNEPRGPLVRALGCAARDDPDEVALVMLRRLACPAVCEMDIVTDHLLTAEIVALVGEKRPAIVCIGALPPGGAGQARYLCKRLRTAFPDLKILVGRWGQDREEDFQDFVTSGADRVGRTLAETRSHLIEMIPLVTSLPATARAAPG